MLSRPRPRYDPEVFYPVSPDRTIRMGQKLVNDMDQSRDTIRETNAEKVQKLHSHSVQSPRPHSNHSSFTESRNPLAPSVVRPMELRDAEAISSRPQRSSQPEAISFDSQAQVAPGVHFEEFEELVKNLHDMNMNITQLQMLIDRETELWNLQPGEVPSPLGAVRHVIEAYGAANEEPDGGPSVSSAQLRAGDGPIETLGDRSLRSSSIQPPNIIAESSRSLIKKDATDVWQKYRELHDLPWWDPLLIRSEASSDLLVAGDRRPAAWLPQLHRSLLLPPVLEALDGITPAEPARVGTIESEVDLPASNSMLEASSEGTCSSASHTSPNIDEQGTGRRKTSVGELKKKLARNLLNMAKFLKNGKKDIGLSSESRGAEDDSDLLPSDNHVFDSQSKREGKRPMRQPNLLEHPFSTREDTVGHTLITGQSQNYQELEDRIVDVNPEHLDELPRVATVAAKILKDHERTLLTECVCCGDEKNTIIAFSPHPPTYVCEHPIQTCKACMDRWLSSELAGKGCKSLHCPECRKMMDHGDVIRGASEATREEYDRRLLLMALSEEPEFAWCLAPKCNFGQLNDHNENYMECAGCKYQQCLLHKMPWHTGETCEGYDRRVQFVDESEVATKAMIDGVSKVCPGEGCGWRIQKMEGCDHIICSKCKFQFCYQCRADHKEIRRVGNTAHAKDCKFHSANLAITWPFNVH